MTLKTSLIITGDSATAKAAVDDLKKSVDALAGSSRGAAAPAKQLDAAQKGIATSGAAAAGAIGQVGAAQTGAIASGRNLAGAQNAVAGAITATGTATTRTSSLTVSYSGNQVGAAATTRALAVAQGALAHALDGTGDQMVRVNAVSGTMTGNFAAVAGATGAIAPAADRAGSGIGGLTGKLNAAKLAKGALTVAGGALAGVFTGILTGGISIVAMGLGALIIDLLGAADASDEASEASAALASHVSDLGNYFDLTTGKIKETNAALVQYAILARQKEIDDSRAKIAEARTRGGEALKASLKPRFVGSFGAVPGGMVRGNLERDNDVGSLFNNGLSGAEIAIGLSRIGSGGGRNAENARTIAEVRGEVVLLERKIDQQEREIQAFERGVLPSGMRTAPPSSTRAGGGIARASGGRASGAIDREAASVREAAEANRKLAQDLEAVVGQFDPARKAAMDYAKELERIAKLEAAFDPNKADGGGGIDPKTAQRYRDAAKAVRDQRIAEANYTPEMKAADEARKSIQGVIASLDQERAMRAELDPVQREMIKHRETLALLPEAERKALEGALEAGYQDLELKRAQADAARDAAESQRMLQDAAMGALDALISGGQTAGDVMKRLAQMIATAALEAQLFGNGPLAALLKGGIKMPSAGAAGSGAATQAAGDVIGKSVGKSVGDRLDSLFGPNASRGTRLMAGAGVGFAAGSMSGGSGLGGAAGGAIGGELASKFLTGALGSFAGPLGSIAGGLLGGVIGGLFGGKKDQSTAVVNSGAISSSGSSAGLRKSADGLGGSVVSGLQRIVDQLGGKLGSYNVSIGTYDGDYRVSTSGQTGEMSFGKRNKNKATLYDFGDDQEAAIKFAIQDAIKDGAIQGLSAAVQKAIRSSSDIDKALDEAFKVQEIELLVGGIGAQIDKAFRDFEKTAQERVRIAREYGFDVVAIEKKNAEDRAKLSQQLMQSQVGSLQALVDEMTRGSLFEGSALEKIDALNAEIAKAKADLDAGVDGAGDRLAQLYDQRLSASKDAYGTTGGYAADRQDTLDQARAAIAAANARIVAATGGDAKSDPALKETNSALDENNDQNAKIISLLEEMNRQPTPIYGGGVGNWMDESGRFSLERMAQV